jgi:hypothetical protein
MTSLVSVTDPQSMRLQIYETLSLGVDNRFPVRSFVGQIAGLRPKKTSRTDPGQAPASPSTWIFLFTQLLGPPQSIMANLGEMLRAMDSRDNPTKALIWDPRYDQFELVDPSTRCSHLCWARRMRQQDR